MPSLRRSLLAAGVVVGLVGAFGAVGLREDVAPVARAQVLAPYDDCGELLTRYREELARTMTPYGAAGTGGGFVRGGRVAFAEAASAVADLQSVKAVGTGPTGTNVQEHGVDEPDTAKVVDGVLYSVTDGQLTLVRAGADPVRLARLPLGDDAYGAELLVVGDRVVVLLGGGRFSTFGRGWGPQGPASTRLLLVDVADRTQPRLLEQLEVDGRYLSARLADGVVRLVTSSTPSVATRQPGAPFGKPQQDAALAANVTAARGLSLDDALPRAVRRDADGEVVASAPVLGCEDVRRPSERLRGPGATTLVVSAIDPARDLRLRGSTGVTTDGELVYASAERLVVATSRWGTAQPVADVADTSTATVGVTTELHAFDTREPETSRYAGSTSVDGYVYGRWALSSHEGYLRVATTSAPPWRGGSTEQVSSSVHVLREDEDGLSPVGRVDGLGPDEQVRAVRWFGDRATVVTFRQTDPLYVLDLSEPTDPRVTGELKVPGFSAYLHPVGDDRLLGVGMDADERGRITGFQLSLFDVSDPSAPTQLDRLSLGQGGSPVADGESRAFGFDPERGLAVLPFQSYGPSYDSSALGVRVTPQGTLEEVGRMRVQGSVERVLADGDQVYALDRGGFAAGSAATMERTGRVLFGD